MNKAQNSTPVMNHSQLSESILGFKDFEQFGQQYSGLRSFIQIPEFAKKSKNADDASEALKKSIPVTAASGQHPEDVMSNLKAFGTTEDIDNIQERMDARNRWRISLTNQLKKLGIKVYPTETFFFLADFAPYNAFEVANELLARGFRVKPIACPELTCGLIRITTLSPKKNKKFTDAVKEILQDIQSI